MNNPTSDPSDDSESGSEDDSGGKSWPSIDDLLAVIGAEDDGDLSRVVRILAGIDVDPEVDEREHVFEASTLLAQTAIGRAKTGDETWDDLTQLIEDDDQPALASALWVGLSKQPAARYPSLEQWSRSMSAGLRSDAAADVARQRSSRSLAGGIGLGFTAAVVVGALIAAGWFLVDRVFSDQETVVESSPETSAAGPTVNESTDETDDDATDDDGEPVDDEAGDAGDGETDSDDERGSVQSDDPCAVLGSLGPLYVDQVTDGAIVIGWDPVSEAVNIMLDGGFVDTVAADSNQYVIEHRPLLPPPLPPETTFLVEINTDGGEPSAACVTTLAEPLPTGDRQVGVYAPTGLEVIDLTPTSVTVGWDLLPGADTHNLYLDGRYVLFGDNQGSTTIGDETEFTFFDLEPGTSYDIGVRRVEGFNQSGVSTITVTTPDQ